MRGLGLGLAVGACGLAIAAFARAAAVQNSSTEHDVYIVPKLGLMTTGGGDTSTSCSGSRCGLVRAESLTLEDKADLGFGADLLGRVMPNLRVGGGLFYVPSSKYAYRGNTQTFGSDLSLAAIVEGVLPVSPILSLSLRAQLGMIVLFPGGWLKDRQSANKTSCVTLGCKVSEGPFPGFTWGIGGGGIIDVGPFGLRADLLYQGLESFTFGRLTGPNLEASEQYSGHRFWFLVGGDIGL